MKRFWLLPILFITACAQATPTPALPTPQVIQVTATQVAVTTATVAATPDPKLTPAIPVTPAPPSKLTINADGATLAASYYPPAVSPQAGAQSAPGVLLLHMLGRNRGEWDAFAKELQKRGIAALALDLRGHGESTGPTDWAKAPGDVRAAWEALTQQPAVDPKDTAIVGASIGANLALIAGANITNPPVVGVVALSPGLDYRGVRPEPVLPNFGQRPVFLIASQDDAYAYDSVKQMATKAAKAETYYFTRAGHGTDMFADPALQPLLLDWLTKVLGVLKG
jgi:pimeloyl-ACP methyl ester carboxylesterase